MALFPVSPNKRWRLGREGSTGDRPTERVGSRRSKLRSYFRRVLWIKVRLIKCVRERDCSLQRRFPNDQRRCLVLFQRYSRNQVAKMSEICPQILMFWGRHFFFGGGRSKFLTQFYKLGSASNMCQNLVTIDPPMRTDAEKKETTCSTKSEWSLPSIYSSRAATKSRLN